MHLQCGKHQLDLSSPKIMGILNITPDSFSDGGRYLDSGKPLIDAVLRTAEKMLLDGANILDVGGESTRPGADAVSQQQELDRVIPVIEALVKNLDALVSVDTSSAQVITESAKNGASLINDVRALQRDGALIAAAKTELPICLMHMQGQPKNMQSAPAYANLVVEVSEFLKQRVKSCMDAGIDPHKILLDPGFGFGKTLAHNLALLANLPVFTGLGFPVLVGLSRKSMLQQLLNRAVDERLPGSLALGLAAAERGAAIIRVHDVAATKDVLTVWSAVREQNTFS